MRGVDLFAGCGGLSKGFENAGFHIAAAYEYWPEAVHCYSQNFHHPIHNIDLNDVEVSVSHISKWSPEIIMGGPPCQDFSHAGKRLEGRRADLTVAYAKIIQVISPRWFLMENVDRARASNSYRKAREILKKANYGLSEIVLDASFCGVPQKRKRFFCIGLMDEADGFLIQTIRERLSKKPLTVRQFLRNKLGITYYYRHPRNYNRRAVYSIDEPAATVRGVNRPVPGGYREHRNDAGPVNSRLRPLTTLERARIQTFPKNYKWIGTKTTLEMMIGNAVPVKLGEFVARAILAYENRLASRNKKFNTSQRYLEAVLPL